MYIVWGQKLYGRVDKVPGFFCIATQFGHLDYIPLFPVSSHIVLVEQGKQFRHIPIPLNAKSILLTYGRLLTGAGWMIAGGMACAFASDVHDRDDVMLPAIVGGVLLVVWLLLMFAKRFRMASYERACQLGFLCNLSEAGWEKLNQQYGRTGNLPQPTAGPG